MWCVMSEKMFKCCFFVGLIVFGVYMVGLGWW